MPTISSTNEPSDEFYESFQIVLDGLGGVSQKSSLKNLIKCQELLHLHKLVSKQCLNQNKPASKNAAHLVSEIVSSLKSATVKSSSRSLLNELLKYLCNPFVVHLLQCHDSICKRDYEPVLPQIPFQVDEDEDLAMKIVRLVKNHEPLGATIKCEDDGSVIIARVLKGGVADRSGCIMVGDRVLEINDISVQSKQPAEILKLLTGVNGTVTFKLIPGADCTLTSAVGSNGTTSLDEMLRIRALFNYKPQDDWLHPCPEAGLSFQKGDILCVVDSTDVNWWQAKFENGIVEEPGTPMSPAAGIIASRSLLERKALMRSRASNASHVTPHSTATNKSRKLMYETLHSEMFEHEEVKTYEEVGLLYPRNDLFRPVVLVGPPGVGRNELKRRLLMLNPDRFGTTVPHTSREPRRTEAEGIDYHFSNRNDMLNWARQGQFIEYGEYRGNMYGTLAHSVRNVLSQGRTPILNPHPQALRLLRTCEFKPFIIYVKAPPFPALKQSRQATKALSTLDSNLYSRQFSDRELNEMIENGVELEQTYGHLLDYTLVNANLEFAFRELCDVLQRLEREPLWVPKKWIA